MKNNLVLLLVVISPFLLIFCLVFANDQHQNLLHEKMLVEFPVNPETREDFIAALQEILVDTRAFEGCLSVTTWTNEEDKDKVWLYEEWEDRAHQKKYLNWRTETGNTSHLGAFITGPVRFLWLNEH